MKRVAVILLFAACAAPPPAPTPIPPPASAPSLPAPAPAEERAIGSGRVNASLLNVRSEPSMQGEVVGHARRGERVTILGESGEWLRVRTGGGEVGWVSSQHVARDGATAAVSRRGGCPPDSDYRFVNAPRPSFNEGGPHGVVTIEASVNAQGTVTSTKVISNTTGARGIGGDGGAGDYGGEVRSAGAQLRGAGVSLHIPKSVLKSGRRARSERMNDEKSAMEFVACTRLPNCVCAEQRLDGE